MRLKAFSLPRENAAGAAIRLLENASDDRSRHKCYSETRSRIIALLASLPRRTPANAVLFPYTLGVYVRRKIDGWDGRGVRTVAKRAPLDGKIECGTSSLLRAKKPYKRPPNKRAFFFFVRTTLERPLRRFHQRNSQWCRRQVQKTKESMKRKNICIFAASRL